MKRILYLCYLVLTTTIVGMSQSITISSFKDMPDDITAVSHGTTVLDQNGEKCALIKVETTQTGFSFDVGTLGVFKTEYKPGEIWVYVPYGVKRISISHPSFGVLRDFNFPHALEKGKTYLINLSTGTKSQNVKRTFPTPLNVSDNLKKTVLYSLGKNEIIYCNEQYIDFSGNKNNFACVVADTLNNKQRFIVNGECLAEGNQIYVSHIDLNDPSKCIFMYGVDGKNLEYISIDNKLYGPYEGVMYLADPWRWADYKGPNMQGLDAPYRTGWKYKNVFAFYQMGQDFLFDNGTVTPMPSKYYEYKDGKNEWYVNKIHDDIDSRGVSLNGNYKLKLNGNRLVGNNLNYILPFTPDKERSTLYVFDNGNAVIQLRETKGSSWEWHSYFANLKTGKIQRIDEDTQCVDYQHGELIQNPSSWDRQFERKDASIDWDVESNAICMQDPSLKHLMISNLRYPYVLIDNQKIGKGCALNASYDKATNSFVWQTFEDNAIVLYEYKL